jgi:polysaccharide biosynthesis transport protein
MSQLQTPSFSIQDVLRGMARRRLLILSCLAAGILAGMAILSIFKPSYLAEARVLIDSQATPYDAANVTQTEATREMTVDDRIVASHVAVLQSQDLAIRVIKDLGLAGRPDFDPLAEGLGTFKKFLISFGFSDDPNLMTLEQRALKVVDKCLTVYPVPDSNVIGIKCSASDGKTAADISNTLASQFLLSAREAKSGTNDRARDWLSQQIGTLQTKVVASDAAVEKFRAETGLLKGQTSTLGTQELGELNSQISLAEAARSEAVAKAAEIRNVLKSKGSVDANQDVLNSPTIQSLRTQQVSSERKITELSATYLPNHPKMVAATKELAGVNTQIRREALKVVEGLQGQANIAAARADSLRKSLETMKGREGDAAQDEVKLKELEREAKANRDQLEAMMSRYADSNTRKNLELQPGFARIVQMASAPAVPYFPKSGPMMLLTSLAGLGLGMGLAFLLEIMAQAALLNDMASAGFAPNRSTRREAHPMRAVETTHLNVPEITPETPRRSKQGDVRSAFSSKKIEKSGDDDVPAMSPGVPPVENLAPVTNLAPLPATIATLPMLRSVTEARSLLLQMESNGNAAEAINRLVTQLQDLRQPNKTLACAFSGIGAGLEVGTATLATARALARLGVKTMLVDLEADRPLIPDLLELPFAPGLSDLISGKADFTKAIQRDEETGLQVIRHGLVGAASDAVLGQRMEAVTKTLSGIYDMVLVNVGEASPSTLSVVKGCSAAFLYAPGKRQKDAAAAAFTLRAHGIRDVGIVNVELPVPAAA